MASVTETILGFVPSFLFYSSDDCIIAGGGQIERLELPKRHKILLLSSDKLLLFLENKSCSYYDFQKKEVIPLDYLTGVLHLQELPCFSDKYAKFYYTTFAEKKKYLMRIIKINKKNPKKFKISLRFLVTSHWCPNDIKKVSNNWLVITEGTYVKYYYRRTGEAAYKKKAWGGETRYCVFGNSRVICILSLNLGGHYDLILLKRNGKVKELCNSVDLESPPIYNLRNFGSINNNTIYFLGGTALTIQTLENSEDKFWVKSSQLIFLSENVAKRRIIPISQNSFAIIEEDSIKIWIREDGKAYEIKNSFELIIKDPLAFEPRSFILPPSEKEKRKLVEVLEPFLLMLNKDLIINTINFF